MVKRQPLTESCSAWLRRCSAHRRPALSALAVSLAGQL